MPVMAQQMRSVSGGVSKESAGLSTLDEKSLYVRHSVRKPRAAMSVVVSSNSARKVGLRGTVLPSVLTALVHLLKTSSAAPCTAHTVGLWLMCNAVLAPSA